MAGSHPRKGQAAEHKDSKKQEVERELDEALEESFPGSDPVSISQPKPGRQDKDPD